MLNNLRNKFDPMFEKVGVGFASLGFGPSFWTWIGLLLSIISAIMFSLHSPAIGVPWYTATVLGGIFLIVAGFFDAVDGAVARATKKTSALGSFLDSVIDKVSEIIVFVGILIGSYTNPVLVLVALSLSLLVSYTRAKGESMGVDLKGKGIAERAERILILSILAFIPFRDNISVALWIISILAVITVIERLRVVSAIFGVSIFSIQAMRDIFKRDVTATRSNGFSSTGTESNTTKFSNDQSSTSKVTSSIKDLLKKPEVKKETRPEETRTRPEETRTRPEETRTRPEETRTRPEETRTRPEETRTTTPRKAVFIDSGSDPNETGRNTDQIISELEEEDRKYVRTVPPSPSPSPDLKKDNKKPSTTTSSTTTTSTSEKNVQKEDNEKAKELQ